MPANTAVGTFTTADANAGDTHTYSLVSGTGSTDNGVFTIAGNTLKINVSPDYETKNSYNIRIKTDDGKGGAFEKAFVISVNNRGEVGPVGINNGITLWLDASDIDGNGDEANNPANGSEVVTWRDKSGANHNAVVVAGQRAARVYTEQVNGKPVVRFSLTDPFHGTVYKVDGVDLRAGANPDVTIFTVYKQGQPTTGTQPTQAVWGIDNGGWDRFFFTRWTYGDAGAVSLGPGSQVAVVEDAGKPDVLRLLTAVYDGTVSGGMNKGPADESAVYFNGKAVRKFTDTTHPADGQPALNIGWDGDDNTFNGEIAEMMVYDRKLTLCEIEEINFYLSQKYGVDFTNIASNYNLPAPYDQEVNGIGKLDNCSFTTVNTASSGILTLSNPSDNDVAGEYLTFGNDQGGLTLSTEAPIAYAKRLTQKWRVDKDGDVGTVDVAFDLSGLSGIDMRNADNFALLVDADGDFSNAAAITGGVSVEGSKVTFTGVAFTHGNYLTLATELGEVTVAMRSTEVSPTNSSPIPVIIEFNQAVTGLEIADITVTGGTASNLLGTAASYTVDITPTAALVKVEIAANVASSGKGLGNKAAEQFEITFDATRPTATLATDASEHVDAPFTVNFTFSEPVSDFVVEAITVTNGTASDFVKVSATSYTAVITPATDGEVRVSVAAHAAQDAATNGNEASEELNRVYDATRPTVTLATAAADYANAPFTVSFSFSEAVSSFIGDDITVDNGTASDFTTVSSTEYTALITPAADGAVSVQVPAGVAQDAATNSNEASAGLKLMYDATAPVSYTIAFNTNRVDVTNVADISLSIAGAEPGTTYTYSIASNNGGTPVTGTALVATADFNLSNLDLTGLNDGTLTATLYLVDAAGNRGADATAQAVKITRDVVAVTTPATIKVPIRTTYANVPLPAKVEVTYTNNEKQLIGVNWAQGNYNGTVAGAYELTGELILEPGTSNLNNMLAKVTVEVQPNKVPTALSFSATTFKPDAKAEDVIGTFATTDPDDSEHTYALVSGQGDANNELFEIMNGNELHLKSNQGLSGQTQFTIRVRTTDTYNNSLEQSFALTKAVYAKPEDQLKIVNAFSPDGDGINDTWTIPELRFYNSVEIEVFDRSGVRVFRSTNPEEGWDGKDANGQVRQGPFLYIVQVKDIAMVKKGVVTILKK